MCISKRKIRSGKPIHTNRDVLTFLRSYTHSIACIISAIFFCYFFIQFVYIQTSHLRMHFNLSVSALLTLYRPKPVHFYRLVANIVQFQLIIMFSPLAFCLFNRWDSETFIALSIRYLWNRMMWCYVDSIGIRFQCRYNFTVNSLEILAVKIVTYNLE